MPGSRTESAILAVGMLGATVMPHAIYLHSALIRDRHGRADPACAAPMLRTIRLDVALAMVVAGTVNVGCCCGGQHPERSERGRLAGRP